MDKALTNGSIRKITHSWEPIGTIPQIFPNNTFKMRKMQVSAYATLHDKPYAILNGPTAAGKTLAICWITAKRLFLSPTKKAIIAVPQTIIASGFKGYYNLSFTDEQGIPIIENEVIKSDLHWAPAHYLCEDSKETNESRIQSFLAREGNKNDINDRVLICTHASLVDAFKKFPSLFKNLVISIDEAHHIRYSVENVDDEEIEEDEEHSALEFYNQIGGLVSKAIKSGDIELILSTATMFRGDRLEVIPEEMNSRFSRFYYPMDAYLRDCHYLRGFSYSFGMYKDKWHDRLAAFFDEGLRKTIVYLPSVGSKYSYGSKHKDLEQIYRAISGKKKYEIQELYSGITQIKRGDKWVNVVNLVDDSNSSLRERRKQVIAEAHDFRDNSKIDVIIALNMFREGANWKWADSEVLIGAKGSIVDMNQILGRLFRDAPDKQHIHALQLLPFSFDQLDKEAFRENLNEYSKVIFATMLLEDAICPVALKLPIKKPDSTGSASVGGGSIDYLRLQVGDENKILGIWEEIRNAAIVLQDNGIVDFGVNSKVSRKKFEEVVSKVLTDNSVASYHKEIAEQIRKRWICESLKSVEGIDLSSVDFDVIQMNPLAFWIDYTSGMCGLDTFKKFRDAFAKYGLSPEYNLAVLYPELVKDWHPTLNGDLTPSNVTPMSDKFVWWTCEDKHEYETPVKRRALGGGCPYCANKKIDVGNCLATTNPMLSEEWHPTKNEDTTPFNVSSGSGKMAWWVCKNCGGEYKQRVGHKTNGIGCPICSGRKSNEKNCLAAKNPELAKEWHPTKNGKITPFDVTPGSNKKVWWKCSKCSNEWEAIINPRSKGEKSCKRCMSLALKRADLLPEWDYEKNSGIDPYDISNGSDKKVFWKCSAGHSYRSVLNSRSLNGTGCPRCSGIGTRMSFEEAKKKAREIGIKSYSHYMELIKNNQLPEGFPKCPYSGFKKEGWKGFKDFLGL